MAEIKIKTAEQVVPQCYAYTTPGVPDHDGWTKIGFTERDVETRIKEQTHTVGVKAKIWWHLRAMYMSEPFGGFTDKDFHAYLKKLQVPRESGTEWFRISPAEAKRDFIDFTQNHGVVEDAPSGTVIPYILRREQKEAVQAALSYFKAHKNGEFLWNAKPRFGKTLSAYDLCKHLDAESVLIVTNRPAIANSWYEDYCKFFGVESGYQFVSNAEALVGKPHVQTREEYIDSLGKTDDPLKCIEFVSLQDLKGSVYFGGRYDKLKEVKDIDWDLLVIDEAHEGVDTYKTDVAFDHIKRKATLHLSGTPFKALANDKFPQDAIYNWTYSDEQRSKRDWDCSSEQENPYENLPKLNLYTYQMSEIVEGEVRQGVNLDGEDYAYAFDLNEFFSTNGSGKFVHEEDVDKFLDALTKLEKFPFSTPDLREELKHTLWLLNRVDSAKALAKKLEIHPVFKEYKVILAAGDGKLSEEDEVTKAYDRVTDAISKYDKTITLSVGQLTTGVTIPQWTAVLMLSSIKSPALYMQAAFRAQNPYLFQDSNGNSYRKENAYIFDFDPARTLILYEEMANDLSEDTSGGKGDSDVRKRHVRELLNFFPVIAEDRDGKMIELDAEKVLSIPRKLKSVEVVKRGFMSDFLFQNISNVFHAPQEVIDIISSMDLVKEPDKPLPMNTKTGNELSVNQDGEVEVDEDWVIGKANDLFGDKVFAKENLDDDIDGLIKPLAEKKEKEQEKENRYLDQLKKTFHQSINQKVVEQASEEYGKDMSSRTQKTLDRKLKADSDRKIDRMYGDYKIQKNTIEVQRSDRLEKAESAAEQTQINREYDQKQAEAATHFKQNIQESVNKIAKEAGETVVTEVETQKRETKKKSIEGDIRDHLRGFSRTIPSFLMAYGESGEEVTLESFDKIVPEDVFQEVTSISLDQFRFLRDGGEYFNKETGQNEHFEGHLFDPVVFDDSVSEFLHKKRELADYFDEEQQEDIFDYIPPQKTNQIFTPRWVVRDMVDRLEQENPGCFDNPDYTFADLYMKSGMYITEIVTRLYQSKRMKALFPDGKERLRHIFAKQVYGCAPTEIIYRICKSYILGFSDEVRIDAFNIKLCDALKYAKEGTLEQELMELFPQLKV